MCDAISLSRHTVFLTLVGALCAYPLSVAAESGAGAEVEEDKKEEGEEGDVSVRVTTDAQGRRVIIRERVIRRRVVRGRGRPAPRAKPTPLVDQLPTADPDQLERSRRARIDQEQASERADAAQQTQLALEPASPAGLSDQTTVESEDGSGAYATSPKDAEQTPWSVRLEGITDAPLQIGAGLLIEAPARLRLRSSVGVMSGTYIRWSNALIDAIEEDYPEQAAELISNSLENSLVWRTQLGLRPFAHTGLYVHGGYTYVRLGGAVTGAELLEAALAIDVEEGDTSQMRVADEVEIDSALHMIDAELGWEWWPATRLSIRLGVGLSYTFSSSSEVTARFDADRDVDPDRVAELERAGEDYLNLVYQNYLHPPTVTLALGWRF